MPDPKDPTNQLNLERPRSLYPWRRIVFTVGFVLGVICSVIVMRAAGVKW